MKAKVKMAKNDSTETRLRTIAMRNLRKYKKHEPFCETYGHIMDEMSNTESVDEIETFCPHSAEALRLHIRSMMWAAGWSERPRMSPFEEGKERNIVDDFRVVKKWEAGHWYLYKDDDQAFDAVHRAYEDLHT